MLYPLGPLRCSPRDLAEIARELAANRFPLYCALAAICASVLVLELVASVVARRGKAWDGQPRWLAWALPLAAGWALVLALWAWFQSTHYFVAWSCIVSPARIPWTQALALRAMPIAIPATMIGTAALGVALAISVYQARRKAPARR